MSVCFIGRDCILEGDSPASVHCEQRQRANHVESATLEAGDDQGDGTAGNKGPCGVPNVELLLRERVLDADHLHKVAEVVSGPKLNIQ